MDRKYDNVEMMKTFLNQSDHFVIQLKKNHYLLHQNKKLTCRGLALRRKGKITFRT